MMRGEQPCGAVTQCGISATILKLSAVASQPQYCISSTAAGAVSAHETAKNQALNGKLSSEIWLADPLLRWGMLARFPSERT
jgi:hypothetical protein